MFLTFELTCRPPYIRIYTELYVKPPIFPGQVQRLVSFSLLVLE
jgi:hypothetical protein